MYISNRKIFHFVLRNLNSQSGTTRPSEFTAQMVVGTSFSARKSMEEVATRIS